VKNNPLVSIVVLNWNGRRFIDPFMASFEKQTYPHSEIELLFVDNGSSDGSVSYLEKNYAATPNLRVIKNGDNYGYAGGNNRGMRHAKGQYVLVCNNDLVLDKNLVSELVNVAREKNAAATVPKLMYLNKPGIINNAGSRLAPDSDWPVYEDGANEKDTGQFDTTREITAFCGACVLFSREFLNKVGMFDRKFFLYFEDGDLSWRGQKAGYRFFYAPKAVALHAHTGSTTEGSPIFNYYVGRNRLLILLKNAKFKVFLRGLAKTLRDHIMLRLKNLYRALRGRYSKRQAWHEFILSQKMLWATLLLSPYILLKRWRLIKEETL